jgi:hypothetical protein
MSSAGAKTHRRRTGVALALSVPIAAFGFVACSKFGSAEAVSSDAGDSSSGPSDAGVGHLLDGAKFSCEGVDASLCEDFDGLDGGYRNTWTSIDVAGGGSVFIDPTRSASPPSSLRAAVPGGSADAGFQTAGPYKSLGTGTKSHVIDEFDLSCQSASA